MLLKSPRINPMLIGRTYSMLVKVRYPLIFSSVRALKWVHKVEMGVSICVLKNPNSIFGIFSFTQKLWAKTHFHLWEVNFGHKMNTIWWIFMGPSPWSCKLLKFCENEFGLFWPLWPSWRSKAKFTWKLVENDRGNAVSILTHFGLHDLDLYDQGH